MLFTSVTEDFWVTKLGKITGVMTFSQGYTVPLKILVGNSATLESAPAQTGLHVRLESKCLGIRFIYWKEIFTCQRFLLLCHWHPMQSLNIFYRARKKKMKIWIKNLLIFIIMQLSLRKITIYSLKSLFLYYVPFRCPMLNRKCYKNVCPRSETPKCLTVKWETVTHVALVPHSWNIYLSLKLA